jgi:hypothetical protein
MRTIWKFPFEVADVLEILMPSGAEILDVQVQHGQPCLWALVHSERPTVRRRFRVFGTGHLIEGMYAAKYVGTFQIAGGALVFHVFEPPSDGPAASEGSE